MPKRSGENTFQFECHVAGEWRRANRVHYNNGDGTKVRYYSGSTFNLCCKTNNSNRKTQSKKKESSYRRIELSP